RGGSVSERGSPIPIPSPIPPLPCGRAEQRSAAQRRGDQKFACPKAAQRTSLRISPTTRAAQGSPKGPGLRLAFSLLTCLLAKQKKVSRLPGRDPAKPSLRSTNPDQSKEEVKHHIATPKHRRTIPLHVSIARPQLRHPHRRVLQLHRLLPARRQHRPPCRWLGHCLLRGQGAAPVCRP